MKKILIWAVSILGVIFVALFIYGRWSSSRSPHETVAQTVGAASIKIVYSRPYKKGREIFGGLVPYGKTWRTGANEATSFETSAPLMFGDQELKAGTYSLWTVPGEQSWEVAFNSTMPPWGITYGGDAQRDPATDVLKTTVPVQTLDNLAEQFTISVVSADSIATLELSWDKTKVAVPFTVK